MTQSNPSLLLAKPDLLQAITAWQRHLSEERRYSGKTLVAYERDIRQFLQFIAEHRGDLPDIAMLGDLRAQDLRAFLARRRMDGMAARSLGRQMAGIRSLVRFIERRGELSATAFSSVSSPKAKKSLPKALDVLQARALTDAGSSVAEEGWVAARDAAVLGLLYGAGLRISEALGLTRAEAPIGGIDMLRVTGKGGKTRLVPIMPAVRRLVEAYLSQCPFGLPAGEALFRGVKGGPLSPRLIHWRSSGCAAVSDCRRRRRRMRSGIPSPRIFWAMAAISGRFRNCSAMPACRRRRSIRMSTRRGSSMSIGRRIPGPDREPVRLGLIRLCG